MTAIDSTNAPAKRVQDSSDYRRRHTVLVLGVIFAGWLGFLAVLAADGYDFAAGEIGPAGSAEFVRPN